MSKKLIKVNFKEDDEKATIEIPKSILSKIYVDKQNPYIYLSSEYGEINIKRGIKISYLNV